LEIVINDTITLEV